MVESISLVVLAEYFCDRREQITNEWIERVRENRRIAASDALPREELMDHLPTLFDNLTDQLRRSDPSTKGEEAAQAAHAHGEHRWQQHYRLDELLREISVLRLVFMRHLVTFQALHPTFVQETEWRAARIIHSYFDGLAIDSTAQFVTRQQEELQVANRSLAETTAMMEAFNERLVKQDSRRLQMLRTISHEVRNHLNAITVVVTILAKEPNPAVCHEYLEMLSRNLLEISGLMNQLLDFAALLSGGERIEWERIDPGELYDELVLLLHEMARTKSLSFIGTIDAGMGDIVSDRQKLRRIVMNLMTNAIKYTPAGEVSLGFLAGPPGRWAIEVADTGPGIPIQEQSRIFEEFHRVSATTGGQPGAGLGLAITQQLVTLLGGHIELTSESGRGTKFRIELPTKPPAASAALVDDDVRIESTAGD
ncbi:MAG TPA: sensor histidine kinase [Chthoniobacteraceae bacterium]|nr:sensor histidine kinase [Chthoniobacteraceae bacterium]